MLQVEQIQDQAAKWRNGLYPASQTNEIPVTVRAVRRSDALLIKEMHDRLSRDSIYYRYLGPNKPTIEDFQKLCSFDGVAGTVLVATVSEPQEKVIAIAYYCMDPMNPSTAEPAVLVEDNFQGRGLGKQIMLVLCQEAIRNGLETFDALIDPANYRVMGLVKGSGLPFESRYKDGLMGIRVWLNQVK